ncbi:hypothetical protein EGR_03559 [Echinococcus granulosus]|uniref:Uncharacterized protein n=1 Tax=Echinococcus granulosus TaxID=6210 RepID=W6UJ50_ECHGR|nr:hypothetical protein EGR_03559 [Echinococcus granulosus]EUB61495.1 hypothetical protein EGR_03559 [Echinococcus granulosus]
MKQSNHNGAVVKQLAQTKHRMNRQELDETRNIFNYESIQKFGIERVNLEVILAFKIDGQDVWPRLKPQL